MRFDPTTKFLFFSYPREIGNPFRNQWARNESELLAFYAANNCERDVFVGLFAGFSEVLDKIVFDFDGYNALITAGDFTWSLNEKNIPYIPLATGSWGIHVYVLLEPYIEKDNYIRKERFTEATCCLLNQTGCYKVLEENGRKRKIPKCDTSLVGDHRRMIRLPQTIRPSPNGVCTYLPLDFWNMSRDDFIEWIRNIHVLDHSKTFTKPFASIDTLRYDDWRDFKSSGTLRDPSEYIPLEVEPSEVRQFLEHLLPKRELREILTANPSHRCRTVAAVWLIYYGHSDYEITDLLYRIGWLDRDWEICSYHVQKIRANMLTPYPRTEREKRFMLQFPGGLRD